LTVKKFCGLSKIVPRSPTGQKNNHIEWLETKILDRDWKKS